MAKPGVIVEKASDKIREIISLITKAEETAASLLREYERLGSNVHTGPHFMKKDKTTGQPTTEERDDLHCTKAEFENAMANLATIKTLIPNDILSTLYKVAR